MKEYIGEAFLALSDELGAFLGINAGVPDVGFTTRTRLASTYKKHQIPNKKHMIRHHKKRFPTILQNQKWFLVLPLQEGGAGGESKSKNLVVDHLFTKPKPYKLHEKTYEFNENKNFCMNFTFQKSFLRIVLLFLLNQIYLDKCKSELLFTKDRLERKSELRVAKIITLKSHVNSMYFHFTMPYLHFTWFHFTFRVYILHLQYISNL